MSLLSARPLLAAVGLLTLPGCSGFLPGSGPSSQLPSAAPVDPTPLAKCKVAANAASPLVTEWPASEKAHLQSLATSHVVAVEYSGCELRIVDSCNLSGAYRWRRTTLATDVVEIENADELYAKLPIGAVALEGELARSGRLAVRSTVAGQLQGGLVDAKELEDAGCSEATHFISAISVGAFQLLSGDDVSGSGSAGIAGIGAGGKSRRKEVVLREAGSREACVGGTDEAASAECASPIQVFLTPMPSRAKAARMVSGEPDAIPGAVHVAFPAPDPDEVWTLRAPGGRVVCTLPCGADVGPVSGNYLQREPRNGAEPYVLHLPQSFPHPIGSKVTAEYQAERGNPTLAKWTFLGTIPMGLAGAGLTTWGIVQAVGTCEKDAATGQEDCFPGPGFLIGTGVLWMALFGGAAYWHIYSHEERFSTYETLPSGHAGQPVQVGFELTPNGFAAKF